MNSARPELPAVGERPTGPGQPVRSTLDGTLGVTTSRVRRLSAERPAVIDVMFIGSDWDGPLDADLLTVTRLAETK